MNHHYCYHENEVDCNCVTFFAKSMKGLSTFVLYAAET